MASHVDVAIIGAGPAGLSAGIIFARNGLKTLIFEARRLPADKPCGEGIMPVGVQALANLGVLPFIPASGFQPFIGIRYYGPSGYSATGLFREGPGWGISRLQLSGALLARACQEADLEIRDNCRAEILVSDANRLQIIAGREIFSPRLVIGADGLNSFVRQQLGLQGALGKFHRWGTRQHFTVVPWSNLVEVYWGKGVEAYITPVGEDQVGVAFLWDKSLLKNKQGGKKLFPLLLNEFPALRERLVGAEPMDLARSVGPLHRTAHSPVSNGAILIGDAAGYLDALTGEGISLALHQALALEKWVVPLLKSKLQDDYPLTVEQLSSYRRTYAGLMKPYYRMTSLALLAARDPWLADLAVRLFRRIPALFITLLSANMGKSLNLRSLLSNDWRKS